MVCILHSTLWVEQIFKRLPLRRTVVHAGATHTQHVLYFEDSAKRECVWIVLSHFHSQHRCCSRMFCSAMYTIHIIADMLSLQGLHKKEN